MSDYLQEYSITPLEYMHIKRHKLLMHR